jgi:hypothetical protein
MSGFANAGNNNIFSVTASPNQTQFTVADPTNLLVAETCASGCKYNGVASVNFYNNVLGTGVANQILFTRVAGQPLSSVFNYCFTAQPSVIVPGNGTTFTLVGPPCP